VRKVEAEFTPELASARLARRFVDDALCSAGVPGDLAILLVSELATNAVMHARTDFLVRVAVRRNRSVRVEVEDENERSPTIANVPIEATSGRGLYLVQTLSDTWGVDRRMHGKVVWFELADPAPDTPQHSLSGEGAFAS
jgi:anti-sigma regulatory factor (Ser/Thr protein kinase)